MDPNLTAILSSNQENQLLLNAIKNKFDAKADTEIKAFSPPKFNIPLLRIPENTLRNINSNKTIPSNTPSTELSNFLLQQLQENDKPKDLNKTPRFAIPKFQPPRDIIATQSSGTGIERLAKAINKLQVQEIECDNERVSNPISIDLTTALATKLQMHEPTPASRNFIKPQENDKLDFEIPFIDCDRLDVSRKHKIVLPTTNEYCVTNVSELLLDHSLVEPSAIGRFLCTADNKYVPPSPLKLLSPKYRQQRVKHNIESFKFVTKSPDDLIIIALNKSKRHHF